MRHMTHANTATQPLCGPQLTQPVFAFAANQAQRATLLAYGIPAENIWTQGFEVETLAAKGGCLAKFRGLRGTLVLALEGRALGETRKAVLEAAKSIEAAGVLIFDAVTQKALTLSDLIGVCLSAVAGAIRIRSKRFAKRIGELGGNAKGIKAAARRNAILAEEIVMRICLCPKLTWRERAEILGSQFSVGTLRRKYQPA